jgi:hypothetical protein
LREITTVEKPTSAGRLYVLVCFLWAFPALIFAFHGMPPERSKARDLQFADVQRYYVEPAQATEALRTSQLVPMSDGTTLEVPPGYSAMAAQPAYDSWRAEEERAIERFIAR